MGIPDLPEMEARLATVLVPPELPVARALARLQEAGTGILLVATEGRRLFGVVTDGDVRRHILAGESLDRPCAEIAVRAPMVGPPDMTPAEALALMDRGREFVVNQLPVVGPHDEIQALWLRSDLVTADGPEVSAVIMAGGLGTRLRPLTETVPKPMLPVGDRPLLERTIARLRAAGICEIKLTTHYLADHIAEHFGDGRDFGVALSYVTEEHPLGTAGALRQLGPTTRPVLVVNGDILTGVDFHAMLDYHRAQRADVTVGVRKYEIQVPYGVMDCVGSRVRAIREKPVERYLVNAGLYLIEPAVLDLLPPTDRCDMTDLLQRAIERGRSVVSFPVIEYWLDIGQAADYLQAQRDAAEAKI